MAVRHSSVKVPEVQPDDRAIDRGSKHHQARHGELLLERCTGKRSHAGDPVARGKVGVQAEPFVEHPKRLVAHIQLYALQRVIRIPPVACRQQQIERSAQIEHVVRLVREDDIEPAGQVVLVEISKRVGDQAQGYEAIGECRQILRQALPLAAGEQWIAAYPVTEIGAGDRPFEEPPATVRQLARRRDLGKRVRIRWMQIA